MVGFFPGKEPFLSRLSRVLGKLCRSFVMSPTPASDLTHQEFPILITGNGCGWLSSISLLPRQMYSSKRQLLVANSFGLGEWGSWKISEGWSSLLAQKKRGLGSPTERVPSDFQGLPP